MGYVPICQEKNVVLRLPNALLQGLDIGPDALSAFSAALAGCRTVLWNGPMGVFEFDRFATGTLGVARAIAALTPQVRA